MSLSRRLLLTALGAAAAAVVTPMQAAAAVFYDSYRSAFFAGNIGVGTAPFGDDRIKVYVYNPTAEMTVLLAKTGGDRGDINVDGAAIVKHSKAYAQTPGYAHTMQVYAEAGMNGLILGSNDFLGASEPFNPAPTSVPCGFVALELGPLWPFSEKARLNNRGDLVVGWSLVRRFTGSQAGTTVATADLDFQPEDVGRFVCWGDFGTDSRDRHADRIVEFVDAGHVRVETARAVPSQAARVCTPRALLRDGVLHLLEGAPGDVAAGSVALFVEGGALKAKGASGTVTVLAPA